MGTTGTPAEARARTAARGFAQRIVDILIDGKAEDTVLLDISGLSIIADFFIVTSGTSDRQVRALASRVIEKLAEEQIKPRRIEGLSDARWVVLDFGDVVVHVFTPADRRFYDLEELWGSAVTIARVL
ncbi:MAG: ribosome silencing factor [Chloroflexi bacterium]|nr:ribosome silencing factor [Chloroflexota bacterium]